MKSNTYCFASGVVIAMLAASGCTQTNKVEGPLIISGPASITVADDDRSSQKDPCIAPFGVDRFSGCEL